MGIDLKQSTNSKQSSSGNSDKQAIVYIITKLELGGAQKVCLSLFKGVQERGETASLITGAQGALVDAVAHTPHTIFLDELKREVSFRYVWLEIKTFQRLIIILRDLKKEHPQLVVHTHSTKAGLLGRWAAFFAGVKRRVHTIHGYGFHDHQPFILWFSIYFLELITSFITTHYVCVSSEDVKIGLRLIPNFGKKYSVIRAAVDAQFFFVPARQDSLFPEQGKPFVFGTISCFKKQKNIWDLLRAFEHVYQKNSNIRLEIIGDGVLRKDIEGWIMKHHLSSVITLHGWQNNVAPFLMNWHAFVLSSLWEGLPCSIIEARLMKLPILSYNTGGIPDVIFSGENGLLYPKGNWRELAQGMFTLTHQPQLYTKLQTFQDDFTEFSTSAMVEHHIQLYRSLEKRFGPKIQLHE